MRMAKCQHIVGSSLFYHSQSHIYWHKFTAFIIVYIIDENETQFSMDHVTFPSLFGEAAQDDTTAPYEQSSPITVTQDAISPTVHSLVSEQSGLRFKVAWVGYDASSGIAGYDVQYQLDGGAWTGWFTDTLDTEEMFMAVVGCIRT